MADDERLLLLVDVDATLALFGEGGAAYAYNEALISKIGAVLADCDQRGPPATVCLFTAQLLNAPSFVFQPAQEPLLAPSRLKLTRHLAKRGIPVRAVCVAPGARYAHGSLVFAATAWSRDGWWWNSRVAGESGGDAAGPRVRRRAAPRR